MWNWLMGKKTYIIMAGAVLYAWLGFGFGHIDFNTAIEMTLAAFGAGAIRHGIETK